MPGTREKVCNPRWFSNAFGFPESTYAKTKDKFSFENGELHVKGDSTKNFHVGPFDILSLQQLREMGASTSDAQKAVATASDGTDGLTFCNMIAGSYHLHHVPENAGAVFQVMSLFNCMQANDPQTHPKDGVTSYASDATQGPASAIACPAATIYRNYLVPVDEDDDIYGQGESKQLNCLAGIEELVNNKKEGYWRVTNGYCMPRPNTRLAQLGRSIQKDRNLADDVEAAFRVGVHWDTEVASGSQRVCQVLCSTVPVAFTKMVKADDWHPLARLMLQASYEATFAVANVLSKQRNARVKVFLTAIGGGSMGNRIKWINDAMASALKKHADSPLDVVLIHHKTPADVFVELEKQENPPPPRLTKTISEQMSRISEEIGPASYGRRNTGRGSGAQGEGSFAAHDESEVTDLLNAFAVFDGNGDGCIDRGEFEDMLSCIDTAFFTRKVIDQLIKQADADGDGVIQYAEFVTWLLGDIEYSVASRILSSAGLAEARGNE